MNDLNQAIRKQLRIMGYNVGSVEWDGAMAAARAYAARTTTHGQTVTLGLETAQRLYDLATDSPLMCSGSFETEDVIVLRELAKAIGLDPIKATPDEFVRDFPHPYKPFNINIEREQVHTGEYRFLPVSGGEYEVLRPETDEEVHARLGEIPDRCSAGSYNRQCKRPASDPIHQAAP